MASGGGGGGLPGALQLIETVVLGANAQDVVFSGLNGNVDGAYIIIADIVSGPGSGDVNNQVILQPNGDAGNASSGWLEFFNGSSGTTGASAMVIGLFGGNGGLLRATFYPKTGRNRLSEATSSQCDGANTPLGQVLAGQYSETVTNITSLKIHAVAANGFGVGSVFSLYKLKS